MSERADGHPTSGEITGGGERYVLVLAPITGSRWASVPRSVRLRRLLKAAARSFGLRVVEIRTEDSERNGKDRAA